MSDKCPACGGRGRYLITSCPRAMVTHETNEFLMFYDFAEKGDWPLTGGIMDQSQAFVDAVRWMRSEDGRWRRQLMARD